MKRIHNINIKLILTDDTVPSGDPCDTKEPDIRQDFIWSAGPSAIEIITKGEFNTDTDTIKTDKLIKLFREYYMPKRNTYKSRGDFKDVKQEDLLISKFITSITDKKLREKLIREKTDSNFSIQIFKNYKQIYRTTYDLQK